MAFGRLERSTGPQPMSDINMTPLIDVMLVLLVIFMITAPLMSSALRLDLPRAEGAQPTATRRSPSNSRSTPRAGCSRPARRSTKTALRARASPRPRV